MTKDQERRIWTALRPNPQDPRLTRLGKLAALALIDDAKPVTRTTLVAMSRSVDPDVARRKRGFSEASLKTNQGLRRIYLIARTNQPAAALRHRGFVAAHILRMTKSEIATAIVVGRMATLERDDELRRSLARLGRPFDMTSIAALRAVRDALPANRHADLTTVTDENAGPPVASGSASVADVAKAKAWAARRKIRPTVDWVAKRCGLHPGTVERLAMLANADARNIRTFDFAVWLPPPLLRHRKWDLARALQVERDLIRLLHSSNMTIAPTIIDADLQRRRAERPPEG